MVIDIHHNIPIIWLGEGEGFKGRTRAQGVKWSRVLVKAGSSQTLV
jgi:hypothetical protein